MGENRDSTFMEIKCADEMGQSQGLSLHPEGVALRDQLGPAATNSSSSVAQLQDIPSAHQPSELTRKRKLEGTVQLPSDPKRPNKESVDPAAVVDEHSSEANSLEAEVESIKDLEEPESKNNVGPSINASEGDPHAIRTPAMWAPQNDSSEATPELFEILPKEGEERKNQAFLLEQLVEHRRWKAPNYLIVRTTRTAENGSATYFCAVVVEEKVWAAAYLDSESEETAKQTIAEECRTNILNETPPAIQLVENSKLEEIRERMQNEDLEEDVKFEILEDLASRWGLFPKYDICVEREASNGDFITYSCRGRVLINGVKWPDEHISAESVEQVAFKMAAKVLENICRKPFTEEDKKTLQQTAAVEFPSQAEMKLWTKPTCPSLLLVLGRSDANPYSQKTLSEVLAEGGWGKPKYKIVATRNEAGEKVYFCRAILNEKVWAAEYLKCKNKTEARLQIADQLGVNLLLKTPPAIQLLEKSRIPEIQRRLASGESALGILDELARSWGLKRRPLVTCTKNFGEESSLYWCKLVINQVEWLRKVAPFSTVSEAESNTAVEGLHKIILECSKVDENHVVLLPLPFQENFEIEDKQGSLATNMKEEDRNVPDHSMTEPDCNMDQESLEKPSGSNLKKSPVQMLQELAAAKGWSKPEHYLSRQFATGQRAITNRKKLKKKSNLKTNTSSSRKQKGKSTAQLKRKHEFSCRVVVNGVEYQPDPHSPRHQTRQKAISHVYLECLEKLSNPNIPINQEKQEGERKEDDPHKLIRLDFSFPDSPRPSSVQLEFQNMYELVSPSHSDVEGAVEIVSALRRRLSQERFPKYDVGLFRYWSFNNSDSDGPLLYIYNKNTTNPEDPPQDMISTQEIDAIFDGDTNAQETFRVVKLESTGKRKLWRVEYQSKKTWTLFSLIPIANENLLVIQTNRLLEYLCTFDVRCNLLIVLAEYWVNVNSIEIGERSDEDNSSFASLILPYMVVFFLCQKGILPTPREVQKQPHSTLIDPVSGEDIGFSQNPEFAQNWISWNGTVKRMTPANNKVIGKNLTWKVLQLFEEFLQFHRKGRMLTQEKLILNVRDAEWIKEQVFLNSPPVSSGCMQYISSLKLKENKMLREVLQNDDKGSRDDGSPTWYMANPFVVTSKFPVSNQINRILYCMLQSGRKLGKCLRSSSRKKNKIPQSLQSVLKICEMNKMIAEYEIKRENRQTVQ